MIALRSLSKDFPSPGGGVVRVLHGVDLEIAQGERVALVGPSGSGKSTLLGIVAGLERPTTGTVHVAAEDVGAMDERARAAFRARTIGFVFQSHELMGAFDALENVVIAAEIAGVRDPRGRARDALERVGLSARAAHRPAQLSGGERQRVGIARAIVTRPRLLLADEPTGSLDEASATRVLDLLDAVAAELESTVVVVTHDRAVAARAGRVIALAHGRIVAEGRDA